MWLGEWRRSYIYGGRGSCDLLPLYQWVMWPMSHWRRSYIYHYIWGSCDHLPLYQWVRWLMSHWWESGGGVAQGHKELLLTMVVGAYFNCHISYNTYMIVKQISYSDMNRNKRFFKHRISSIFHNMDLWHFRNIGGSIADSQSYNMFFMFKHWYRLLMLKHACCEYTDLKHSYWHILEIDISWHLQRVKDYVISGRDIFVNIVCVTIS
jgi:hypothetical protein